MMGRHPLRWLIKTGAKQGSAGALGRFWGRRVGYRLRYGPRLIIGNPSEYMQRTILRSGVYERGVVDVLLAAGRPGDLVLDIGANMGQHSLIAASNGMRVHAFEPLPRLAERLRANVALNRLDGRISVHACAVSNTEGRSTIHEMRREDDGSHSLLAMDDVDVRAEVVVQTVTVDGFLRSQMCEMPAIIKIDVEGAEALVLDGARETLSSADRPVVLIETGHRLSQTLGETAETVLGRLLSREYRVFEIDDGCAYCEEVPRPAFWPGSRDYVAVPTDSDRLTAVADHLHGWYAGKGA